VLRVGARPVFAEIEERTLGLDPADVERRITPRSAAIIPVDYAGVAPDMEALAYLYDDTTPRIAKGLRPNPESVRSILDQIAIDDPRARQLSEKDHWNLTLLDEIQQSGFLDKLYRQ